MGLEDRPGIGAGPELSANDQVEQPAGRLQQPVNPYVPVDLDSGAGEPPPFAQESTGQAEEPEVRFYLMDDEGGGFTEELGVESIRVYDVNRSGPESPKEPETA